MKKKTIIIGLCALAAVLIIVGALVGFGVFESAETQTWKPMTITQANVASVISRTNVINDLPSDARVEISIGDQPYALTSLGMVPGALDSPDVIIHIPESYLETMGKYGPCAALAQARNNGDLGFEIEGTPAGIAWKYRSMAKYKACLG